MVFHLINKFDNLVAAFSKTKRIFLDYNRIKISYVLNTLYDMTRAYTHVTICE